MDESSAAKPKPSRSFRREIFWVLIIKLVLILTIKAVFFSHPVDKAEAGRRIGMILGGSATSAPESPSKHFNTME